MMELSNYYASHVNSHYYLCISSLYSHTHTHFLSESKASPKPLAQLKNAVGSTFVAATIAANVLTPVADAAVFDSPVFGSSSNNVAVTEVRQGVYKEYEIDVTPQQTDNAESTFKSAKETKSKKGECDENSVSLYISIYTAFGKCFLCSAPTTLFLLYNSFAGKYTALLAVLVVGSFIIPMAQYFWYVRDDDSSDQFFAQSVAPPEPEPPKKKGWFN